MVNEIEMFRGDSRTLNIVVKDAEGVEVPLTGAEIIFSVKLDAKETEYEFQRKNTAANGDASQIEDVDLANGNFKVHIIPANTLDMKIREHSYDVEVTLGSKVYTVIFSKFILNMDITI